MFISKSELEKIEEDIKVLYINSSRNSQAIHALLRYFNLKIERDALIKEEFGIPLTYTPLTLDLKQFIIKPKVKKRIKNEKT